MRVLLLSIFLFLTAVELNAQSPKTEIRAVWISSNYGLDWPHKPYRNSDDISDQQEELVNILDKLSKANFNMVFLQTRLRGDVIYRSDFEPISPYIQKVKNTWSKYDPLAFAISECHKRGMECHAWFVTYPVGEKTKKGKTTVAKYNKEFFLDPGNPESNRYLLAMISEITEKYDVDGIHLDYVRYPEKPDAFPDRDTYQRYGNQQNKGEWRRNNINRFVYSVYDAVKSKKPYVQVSSSVVGMYDKISATRHSHWTARSVYQDPGNWLAAGKQDFIVPMMYYSDDLFFPFVDDWQARSHGRLVVPGLGLYQMDEKESNWGVHKIQEQIQYSRDRRVAGNTFFRARHLVNNKKGIFTIIQNQFYQHPALLPPLTWLSTEQPEAPPLVEAKKSGAFMYLYWNTPNTFSTPEVLYNIYRSETLPIDTNNPENLMAAHVPDQMLFVPIDDAVETGYYYAVTTYDRYHNESTLSRPVFFVTGAFEI